MTELLTTADAARMLGVVPATVRQMERGGKLPALRTASGVRLFDKLDVQRLVHERASATHAMTEMRREEEAALCRLRV